MAEKLLMNEYETPRICVRGVFLCDEVAVPVSVLTWEITQEAWGGDTTLGDTSSDGDVWLGF